jgi:HEAT repeats
VLNDESDYDGTTIWIDRDGGENEHESDPYEDEPRDARRFISELLAHRCWPVDDHELQLLTKALLDNDAEERRAASSSAAPAYATLLAPEIFPLLLQSLLNDHRCVHVASMRLLAAIQHPSLADAVNPIVAKLAHASQRVRKVAAMTLLALHERGIRIVPPLVKVMTILPRRLSGSSGYRPRTPEEIGTRKENAPGSGIPLDEFLRFVALVLAEMGEEAMPAQDALLQCLRNEVERKKRPHSVSWRAYEDAYGRWSYDKHSSLQSAVVFALERLGSPETAFEDFTATLQIGIADGDTDLAIASLRAMRRFGKRHVPYLVEAFRRGRPELQCACTTLVDKCDDEAADVVSELCMCLESDSFQVRLHAAHALAQVGNGARSSVPTLVHALEKDEEKDSVRQMMVVALGAIGSHVDLAVPAIVRTIPRVWSPSFWNAALDALDKLGRTSAAVPELRRILEYLESDKPDWGLDEVSQQQLWLRIALDRIAKTAPKPLTRRRTHYAMVQDTRRDLDSKTTDVVVCRAHKLSRPDDVLGCLGAT